MSETDKIAMPGKSRLSRDRRFASWRFGEISADEQRYCDDRACRRSFHATHTILNYLSLRQNGGAARVFPPDDYLAGLRHLSFLASIFARLRARSPASICPLLPRTRDFCSARGRLCRGGEMLEVSASRAQAPRLMRCSATEISRRRDIELAGSRVNFETITRAHNCINSDSPKQAADGAIARLAATTFSAPGRFAFPRAAYF